MKFEKLTDIKKELSYKNIQELTDICLRLAKFKKENKELLNYLLFDSADPIRYAENVKLFLENDFKNLQKNYYYSSKSLRKILKVMNRYIKYTASKTIELDLMIWFCTNFIKYADTRTSHKPLQAILIRQLDKIKMSIPKMHEDLQFDYQIEFDELIDVAATNISWINKNSYSPNIV